jgi:hypothetical protein
MRISVAQDQFTKPPLPCLRGTASRLAQSRDRPALLDEPASAYRCGPLESGLSAIHQFSRECSLSGHQSSVMADQQQSALKKEASALFVLSNLRLKLGDQRL